MMKHSSAFVFLAFFGCTVALGCAAQQGHGPGHPDNVWRRLQTEHFDLVTDLAEADALPASVALEQTRAALMQAAWGALRITRQTQRIRVVVLASEWDFEHYFSNRISGTQFNLGGETVVLWGTPGTWETRTRTGEFTMSTLRHELVHYLAAGIYGRQPRWFAEGLAQFLETIVITEQGKKAVLGRPNIVALRRFQYVRSTSVKDALSWGKPSVVDNEIQVSGLYGLSWAMVHWMFNARREAFAAYQVALARGDDPDRAWAANFGADEDAMDRTLFEYLRYGNYQEYPVDLAPVEVRPLPATVTAADIQALRAQLALVAADRDPDPAFKREADAHLAAALALEPGNVAALRLSQGVNKNIPKSELVTRLRDETVRRPDDGEAWLFLGQLLESAEREPALRKALALLPGNASAYNNLAWHLLATKRDEEALPLATKAALLAPWNPAVLDTYAAALFAAGRCPDAIRVQMRAVDNIPERTRGKADARSITETLDRYRTSCATAATAP